MGAKYASLATSLRLPSSQKGGKICSFLHISWSSPHLLTQENVLRCVCKISPPEIESVCAAFLDGFKIMLVEKCADLRSSFEAMDKKAAEAANDASKKFEIFGMSCGRIQDFHEGLNRRIGNVLSACTD